MKVLHASLIVLVVAGTVAGCTTRKGTQRITGPAVPIEPALSDVADARLLSQPEEVQAAAARAARSPLVQRAALDIVSGTHAAFLPSGVLGAIGLMKDGSHVRITLLPFQDGADSTHACYVVLLEVNASVQAQTFELIRHREPDLIARGYERVNGGAHGLWLRDGFTYVPTSTGIAKRSPERINWARFSACFVPLADQLISEVNGTCSSMGSFPACRVIGTTAAIVGAAIYCGFMASKG